MFEIYNLKLNNFIDDTLCEFIYIIKSDTSEFVTETECDGVINHFTLDEFQEMAEHICFCLIRNDFKIEKTPKHYSRQPFDKEKFADEYNMHLKALKPELIKNLRFMQKEDIHECYCLHAHWWHLLFNDIFLIAKTNDGYLAFDYALTA